MWDWLLFYCLHEFLMADNNEKFNDWKSRIGAAKQWRDERRSMWETNVDFKRGTESPTTSEDTQRLRVNPDWPLTKAKKAALFSQTPEVRLSTKYPQFEASNAAFAKVLNETLTMAGAGREIGDAVEDCINCSGFGSVIVAFNSRVAQVEVPAVDPLVAQQMQAEGQEVPMQTVPQITDRRFSVTKISPMDILRPVDFYLSDFNKAPWIGRSGLMTWAEAQAMWKLKDEDKDKVVGARAQTINVDEERTRTEIETVAFDEIFYWAYRFDPSENSFCHIKHLVFVEGLDAPVVDGSWVGQQKSAQGYDYVGATKFPIQIVTLSYMTDDPIPPSDTEVGRPQVLELNQTREQFQLQRERSIPIRGYDATRVDPDVVQLINSGKFQGLIPFEGTSQNSIWEVSKADYPAADVQYDRYAKQDLQETWSMGPNQSGSFASGERSASEANIVAEASRSLIGMERARVAEFFTNVAEVMAGLLALHGTFELDNLPQLQGWDRQSIANKFVYTIRPDSTVLLDANQRLERLLKAFNMLSQSPYVDPTSLIKEIIELTGLDPSQIVKQPQPPGAPPLNISIRVSNEDINNPVVLALLQKSGQAPSPEEVEAAKQMLMAAQAPPAPPQPPVDPEQMPEAPLGEPPQQGEVENPGWNAAPKLTKRGDYN